MRGEKGKDWKKGEKKEWGCIPFSLFFFPTFPPHFPFSLRISPFVFLVLARRMSLNR